MVATTRKGTVEKLESKLEAAMEVLGDIIERRRGGPGKVGACEGPHCHVEQRPSFCVAPV